MLFYFICLTYGIYITIFIDFIKNSNIIYLQLSKFKQMPKFPESFCYDYLLTSYLYEFELINMVGIALDGYILLIILII